MIDYVSRLVRATRPKDPTAPEFVKKMDESGAALIPTTSAEFGKQIKQAMERYQRVSQMANIRND